MMAEGSLVARYVWLAGQTRHTRTHAENRALAESIRGMARSIERHDTHVESVELAREARRVAAELELG